MTPSSREPKDVVVACAHIVIVSMAQTLATRRTRERCRTVANDRRHVRVKVLQVFLEIHQTFHQGVLWFAQNLLIHCSMMIG